jgi:hypothetical protein
MDFSDSKITAKLFRENLEEKLNNPLFMNDTAPILHPDFEYSQKTAYERVISRIIKNI